MGHFLSNDSLFGRLMTRVWIIVVANLLFVLCALPVVTIGPALAALYYVFMKMLRSDGQLSPVKTFLGGFKSSWKQGILIWIPYLALMVAVLVEYRFLRGMGSSAEEGARSAAAVMRVGVGAVGAALTIVMLFLIPALAAFSDTIPHLIRNAVYLALKNPLRLAATAAIWILPLAAAYIDTQNQPAYAFCYFFFGFGLAALLSSRMLLPDLNRLLPVDDVGNPESETPGGRALTERKTMREMKRLEK